MHAQDHFSKCSSGLLSQSCISIGMLMLAFFPNHPIWSYLKVIKSTLLEVSPPSSSTSEHFLEMFICSSYLDCGYLQLWFTACNLAVTFLGYSSSPLADFSDHEHLLLLFPKHGPWGAKHLAKICRWKKRVAKPELENWTWTTRIPGNYLWHHIRRKYR